MGNRDRVVGGSWGLGRCWFKLEWLGLAQRAIYDDHGGVTMVRQFRIHRGDKWLGVGGVLYCLYNKVPLCYG
ncbi:hypothetical protein TIFTF001_047651 [Ficus carica]|uniref:Uncharacterized protein n=1 Tax=Ficus carica TaxID=3494 RepID=A0AA88CNG6_FICCA|nr:hypothetical protein TIFTF001_047635 [Ficus carica]GMN24433.1 hypothetical protein TIFTF001_047636 [Ficus carica]GMN24595.1 hypothetical protein TIFTF001_047650 [Ficus carica]GMN24612.1 hypothetical protein TIFTF001_047651 [Ficus carica]